jgi:xylose isomerase
MKTSLGIWALGPMVTRVVPGGYQPEHAYNLEPTAAKVTRAVSGLGDLMDGYELHYPQELSEDNVEEVQAALAGHDVACIATAVRIDLEALREARQRKDAVRAYELVYAALGA